MRTHLLVARRLAMLQPMRPTAPWIDDVFLLMPDCYLWSLSWCRLFLLWCMHVLTSQAAYSHSPQALLHLVAHVARFLSIFDAPPRGMHMLIVASNLDLACNTPRRCNLQAPPLLPAA